MNQRQRLALFFILLAIILVLGLIFWQYVLNDILMPLVLTSWLFLRLFVLSIDQKYYWGALFFASVFFLFRHLIPNAIPEAETLEEETLTHKDIAVWRNQLTLYSQDSKDQFYSKRDLTRLVVSMYAARQGVAANFLVMEALQKGEIAMPENIRIFLFTEEAVRGKWTIKKILSGIWHAPGRWIYERSGRAAADYYHGLDEVLTFLETSLEMKDGK